MKHLLSDGPSFNENLEADHHGASTVAHLEWSVSAEEDLAIALYNLGVLYDTGQGVPQDFPEAFNLYHRAADRGLALAQYNLGLMYAEGHGVPTDYLQAYMWLSLASLQGHEKAKKNCDIAAERMSSKQVEEAQRMAREWLAAYPQ